MSEQTPLWTQGELAVEAERRLAHVLSGRPVPGEPLTERTVRYYRAHGLIDPPLRRKHERSLFGERQLMQLVAIRRLQAEGWPLADITQWLLTATGRELRRLAAAGEPDPPAAATAAAAPRPGAARARSAAWRGPHAAVFEASLAERLPLMVAMDVGDAASPAPPHAISPAPGVYLVIDPHAARLDHDELARACAAVTQFLHHHLGQSPKKG